MLNVFPWGRTRIKWGRKLYNIKRNIFLELIIDHRLDTLAEEWVPHLMHCSVTAFSSILLGSRSGLGSQKGPF